eukprot:5829725-Pleurochrysis_carterae.AAC.1
MDGQDKLNSYFQMEDFASTLSNQLADVTPQPAAPQPAAVPQPAAACGDRLHEHITRAFTQYLTPEQTAEIRQKYGDLRFPKP